MSQIDRMLEAMKGYEPDQNEVDEMLDESEKERLLKSVMGKIEKEKETLEARGGRRNKKHANVKHRVTKIAAAIALVFITGNVVVVGATMLHLNEKFLSYALKWAQDNDWRFYNDLCEELNGHYADLMKTDDTAESRVEQLRENIVP